MQSSSLIPLLAALATVTTATPSPATNQNLPKDFLVTDFAEIRTRSLPPRCRFSFNITVDDVPGKPRGGCEFGDRETDYVLCGSGIPGQTFSAYVEKPTYGGDDPRFGDLMVRYGDAITGPNAYVVFGNGIVSPSAPRRFGFPVVAGSVRG